MVMQNALNILFLGFGASALCFVTWNFAVRALGSVKTSVYIYAVPVITVITSLIFLHEVITWQSACGIVLTLAGLILSESRITLKQTAPENLRLTSVWTDLKMGVTDQPV